MSYEEKIERIFGNTLEFNGDHKKAIDDVVNWLRHEWFCDSIHDMEEFNYYCTLALDIANRMIKNL